MHSKLIRIALIFSFFSIIPPVVKGQAETSTSLTLDFAIEKALLNNPMLVNDSLSKDAIYEIKKAWFNWLHSINSSLTMKELYIELSDLARITELRYESGDIDYFEFSGSRNVLEELVTNIAVLENQSIIFQNIIREKSFITSSIQPTDSSLEMYGIDKFSLDFNNSLESDILPCYSQFIRDLRKENLQTELDNLFIKIQYYRSFGLDYATGIIGTAAARLRSEDIEFLEYIDYATKAYKIRLEYLDVLNRYNQMALQLEDYAY